MLAEALAGFFAIYAIVWVTALVLSMVGLFAGSRGHWSALLLSGASVLIGGMFILSALPRYSDVLPLFKLTDPVPALLGLPGLILWFLRSRKRWDPVNARAIFYVCLACAFVLILTIVLVSNAR
jgi:hypothetical protein